MQIDWFGGPILTNAVAVAGKSINGNSGIDFVGRGGLGGIVWLTVRHCHKWKDALQYVPNKATPLVCGQSNKDSRAGD